MLNEPDDAFDAQLATGWDALAPPSDARARVRARLAATGVVTGGIVTGGVGANREAAPLATPGPDAAAGAPASFTRAIAQRWRALLSSGGVGASVAVLLLGVGFYAGYRSSPGSAAAYAPSALATPAPPAAAPLAAAPPGAAPPAA